MNSMLGKLSGLGVSIESQPPMPVDTPAPEMPVDMDTESLSMVDAAADELSTAVTKHDQLQALATTLESMVVGDGMSDTEYSLFNHASQAITTGTPLDAPVPALESFGTAAARLNNAQVALESVGDKVKAAGEWVSKTISKILKAAADAIVGLLDHLNTAMKSTASKKYPEGLSAGDKVVVSSRYWRIFFISKNVAKSKGFQSIELSIAGLHSYTEMLSNELLPLYHEMYTRLKTTIKHADDAQATQSSFDSLYAWLTQKATSLVSEYTLVDHFHPTKPLPGGRYYWDIQSNPSRHPTFQQVPSENMELMRDQWEQTPHITIDMPTEADFRRASYEMHSAMENFRAALVSWRKLIEDFERLTADADSAENLKGIASLVRDIFGSNLNNHVLASMTVTQQLGIFSAFRKEPI